MRIKYRYLCLIKYTSIAYVVNCLLILTSELFLGEREAVPVQGCGQAAKGQGNRSGSQPIPYFAGNGTYYQ